MQSFRSCLGISMLHLMWVTRWEGEDGTGPIHRCVYIYIYIYTEIEIGISRYINTCTYTHACKSRRLSHNADQQIIDYMHAEREAYVYDLHAGHIRTDTHACIHACMFTCVHACNPGRRIALCTAFRVQLVFALVLAPPFAPFLGHISSSHRPPAAPPGYIWPSHPVSPRSSHRPLHRLQGTLVFAPGLIPPFAPPQGTVGPRTGSRTVLCIAFVSFQLHLVSHQVSHRCPRIGSLRDVGITARIA